jgi:hypothetical protein
MNQALSFASYRTYAAQSIGGLLARTGELTVRTQKRYDDTALLLERVLRSWFDSNDGRTALRRINQMHHAFDISDDDFRYVLSTFVVVPRRWIDRFGWRQLSEAEVRASVLYYRDLGHHMGIRGIPASYPGFEELLEAYEADHFRRDEAALTVSEATLQLMTTFQPNHLLPASVSRRIALASMDDRLVEAFGYPHPTALERRAMETGLRLRGRVVGLLPPRRTARWVEGMSHARSYPTGVATELLGVDASRRRRLGPRFTPARLRRSKRRTARRSARRSPRAPRGCRPPSAARRRPGRPGRPARPG